MNERKWIEEDNQLQRIQTVEFKEKLLKWQTYASQKEQQHKEMANKTAKLREGNKKLRAGLSRVVEGAKTLKSKYNNLKDHNTALLKKYNATKQELDYLITLGKHMREEYELHKSNYMALWHYII